METTGSITGRARILNVMSLAYVPDHNLEMAEVTGSQARQTKTATRLG